MVGCLFGLIGISFSFELSLSKRGQLQNENQPAPFLGSCSREGEREQCQSVYTHLAAFDHGYLHMKSWSFFGVV